MWACGCFFTAVKRSFAVENDYSDVCIKKNLLVDRNIGSWNTNSALKINFMPPQKLNFLV
jgi:hypothetical protein